MNDPHTALNKKQQNAVRRLAVHRRCERARIMSEAGVSVGEYVEMVRFLESNNYASDCSTQEEWSVTIHDNDSIQGLIYQLDNPPPKDHWKAIVAWFRARWWSVPFVVFLVVLPLLVQWVEMLKTLLSWLNIAK